ncbi:hypothetical protein ACIOWG_11630 [Streptomyces sp. NPDC087658]|uniref:hypothetical protein n=1 Tax=Streptomyces sp. NPDC087658 TaxID=3365800 RepID=UPI00380F460C
MELRELYTGLEERERILRAGDLERTSVRPPRLTNGAGRGTYRHAVEAGPPGSAIARAMLDFVPVETTVRHAVGVSD